MSFRSCANVFGDRVAVDKLALDASGGEIVGLVGRNGAKTTTALSVHSSCGGQARSASEHPIENHSEPVLRTPTTRMLQAVLLPASAD